MDAKDELQQIPLVDYLIVRRFLNEASVSVVGFTLRDGQNIMQILDIMKEVDQELEEVETADLDVQTPLNITKRMFSLLEDLNIAMKTFAAITTIQSRETILRYCPKMKEAFDTELA